MSSTLFEDIFASSGRVTLKDALIALTRLMKALVALGICTVAYALVAGLFGTANHLVDATVGWIPWLGGKVKRSLHSIESRVTNFLGEAAKGAAIETGHSLATIGQVIADTAETMFVVGAAVGSLTYYLFRAVGIAAIGPRLGKVESKTHDLWRTYIDSQGAITHGRVVLPRVTADVINARINARLQPLEDELARMRRELSTVEGGLALGGAIALPDYNAGLRERVKEAEQGVENLWKWARSRGKTIAGTGALALVGAALLRLKLGWLKCSNWRKIGKAGCRMDPTQLESLLAGTLVIAGGISIVAFAKELQGVVDEGASALHRFIREG